MADIPYTIVIYHIDEEETPYRSKLKKTVDLITLRDFKIHINSSKAYKYFFKSEDADFGVVKEEINDDATILPTLNGRIEAWLVSIDGSSVHSESNVPCTSQSVSSNVKATTTNNGVHSKKIIMPANQIVSKSIKKHQDGNVSHNSEWARRFRRFNADDRDDDSACTSDTESTLAGLPRISRMDQRFERRSYRQPLYNNKPRPTSHPRNIMGVATSTRLGKHDLEDTSFFDSDDDRKTRVSSTTDITSVSLQYLKRRRRKRLARGLAPSKVSEVSSITESNASLNIVSVVLNLELGQYLGINLAGKSDYNSGDCGIYVSSVIKGGAIALDGRIEAGDVLLQINDIPFQNMTNDEAVKIVQRLVKEPGPIKLIVAKGFDCGVENDFEALERRRAAEPVWPIDPGAWVAHTNALAEPPPRDSSVYGVDTPHLPKQRVTPIHGVVSSNVPTPTHYLDQKQIATRSNQKYTTGMVGPAFVAGSQQRRPGSAATASSNNSGSATTMGAGLIKQSTIDSKELKADASTENMLAVVRAASKPGSGLEIKNRTWLKIEIADSFLGSNLVDWLFTSVHGFTDRRDAHKYASLMFNENFIKHTVNKRTFNEQCYYVFNNLSEDFANMRVADDCSSGVFTGIGQASYEPPEVSALASPSARIALLADGPSNGGVRPLPTVQPNHYFNEDAVVPESSSMIPPRRQHGVVAHHQSPVASSSSLPGGWPAPPTSLADDYVVLTTSPQPGVILSHHGGQMVTTTGIVAAPSTMSGDDSASSGGVALAHGVVEELRQTSLVDND